eukprot:Gb_16385 [translate_table: standard]
MLHVQCGKKRKLEEQQMNLPSPKYQLRARQGSSEGGSFLFHSYINGNSDYVESLNVTKQLGLHAGMMDKKAVVSSSNVLNENIQESDKKFAGKLKTSEARANTVRRIEIATATQLSSASNRKARKTPLYSREEPAYEISGTCGTRHPCISELSEHVYQREGSTSDQFESGSVSSTTWDVGFDRNVRKRTTNDLEFLGRSFEDGTMKDNKMHTDGLPVDYDHHTRFRKSIRQEDSDGSSLLATDRTKAHSLESSISAFKPFLGKRQKSVSTESCPWESESEIVCDDHTGHTSVESATTYSLGKNDNRPNSLVCNVEATTAVYKSIEAPITCIESTKIFNTNEQACSESKTLSSNLCTDNVETLPLYVLSSGRKSFKEETQVSMRNSTIDKEFEEYFSMLMLPMQEQYRTVLTAEYPGEYHGPRSPGQLGLTWKWALSWGFDL